MGVAFAIEKSVAVLGWGNQKEGGLGEFGQKEPGGWLV